VADCCGRPCSEVQPAWVVLADADRDVAAAAWGEPAALAVAAEFAFGVVDVGVVVVGVVVVGVAVVVVIVAVGVGVVEPVFAAAADGVAEQVAVAAVARELAEGWAPAWACSLKLCRHTTYTDRPRRSCLTSSALEFDRMVNYSSAGYEEFSPLQTDSILLTANWIRTGISGFGMSARLLLILFRWPTIVLKIHI
jgi:hypothetical protein